MNDVLQEKLFFARLKFFKKFFHHLFLSQHIIHTQHTHTHTHTHTHIVVVVIILLLLLIIIIMAPRTPSSVHPPANDDVNERAVRKVELSKFHLQFEAEMRNSVMRDIEMDRLRHQERMKARDIEHARKLKEDLDWHEQNMKKDRSEKEQKMELEREMLKLKREQLEFEREQLAFELERDRKRSKTN